MNYHRASIYFTSGTGNSYRVARWFKEACLERNITAEVIPIKRAEPEKEIFASAEQLVVLAFPTHGLMPPWSVIKFLFRMPKRKGAHFLCLPTRGSFYVGPIQVPGASGLASFLPVLVLLVKRYRPKGAVSFDMPVNMTSIHPRLTPRHAGRVITRARLKSEKYFGRFFKKRSLWLTQNNVYEFIWSALILYFIPFFPLLYLIVGRFFIGKTLFADIRCVGCGSCAQTCPAGTLVMRGKKVKRPYWRYNCEHCLRCLNFCPHGAVQAGHSWAVLLWMVGSSVAFGAFLYTQITRLVPQLESFRNYWTVELLDAIYYYPAFIIAYFFFYRLLRFKPINLLFSYTSLGRLFGQYREPSTTLGDLNK